MLTLTELKCKVKQVNIIVRIIFIFFLGVTSVLPTINGNFIFDDTEAILKNNIIISKWDTFSNEVSNIFTNDFWGAKINSHLSHKSYRPLTTLIYRLVYQLWAGENPLPFHLLNLIFHGINCIIVYLMLRKSLRVCIRNNDEFIEKISFMTSILFAIHPVHVENTGALVGLADLISSFVFLIGFFVKSPIFVALFAIVGSLFKENAIVLVLFYSCFDFFLLKNMRLTKKSLKKYVVALVIAGFFVLARIWFHGPPVFKDYDNPPVFEKSFISRTINIGYIWCLNIFILVNPIWLSYDWSMGCISLIKSPFDLRILFCLTTFGVLSIFFFNSFKNKVIMLALLLSSITFLPSSNLIFTVGFVIAERNLYMPSIGFCLLISYCFAKRGNLKMFIYVAAIFYLRSIFRSMEWKNQSQIFLSALNVCPNNAKVQYNLGTLYGELSDTNLAIYHYKKAIELKPDYFQSMNNLANILRTNDKLKEAEYWLRKALSIKSDFAAAWMNLGIVLSKDRKDEALKCYNKALEYRNNYPDCQYNLGNLYLEIGDKKAALLAWRIATKQKSTHSQSWINLIILLEQESRLDEAKEEAYRAKQQLPNDETIYFLLGGIYGKLGNFGKAELYFFKSLHLSKENSNPVPSKLYTNLGVLYHRWGKIEDARKYYKEALRIEPNYDVVKKNLAMLDKMEKKI